MKVDVLLGLQWGDEGKGKVVDVLTPNYDVITRFQGGPNAGHTLEFNGESPRLNSLKQYRQCDHDFQNIGQYLERNDCNTCIY